VKIALDWALMVAEEAMLNELTTVQKIISISNGICNFSLIVADFKTKY